MATHLSLVDELLAENFATIPTRRSMAHVFLRGPQPSDDVPFSDVTSPEEGGEDGMDWAELEMDAENDFDDVWQGDDVRRVPVESRNLKK